MSRDQALQYYCEEKLRKHDKTMCAGERFATRVHMRGNTDAYGVHTCSWEVGYTAQVDYFLIDARQTSTKCGKIAT